jgi:hypothetical protein
MRAYLKIINPAIALVVLALCFWAAAHEKSSFNLYGIVEGGIPTYFLAKGLFSASTVFIVGKILLEILSRREPRMQPESKRSEVIYCLALAGLVLSLLAGLLLHKELGRPATEKTITVKNPRQIQLVEHYRMKESRILRINGRLRNNAEFSWSWVQVSARVFFGERYANSCSKTLTKVEPATEQYFTILCDEFDTREIDKDVRYELELEGERLVK